MGVCSPAYFQEVAFRYILALLSKLGAGRVVAWSRAFMVTLVPDVACVSTRQGFDVVLEVLVRGE
jgi:hypothetical protein